MQAERSRIYHTYRNFAICALFMEEALDVFENTFNGVPFRIRLFNEGGTECWRVESLDPLVPFNQRGSDLLPLRRAIRRACFAREMTEYGQAVVKGFDLADEVTVYLSPRGHDRVDDLIQRMDTLTDEQFDDEHAAIIDSEGYNEEMQLRLLKERVDSRVLDIVTDYWLNQRYPGRPEGSDVD